MQRADDILAIVSAAHTLTRLAAAETKDDAPAAQWRALSVLRADGPMRLGELAAATRTTQPGMTRLVAQLAGAGLVDRTGDPTDSRASIIVPTDAGLRALADWRIRLRDALAPLLSDLTDDDWTALARVAEILSARTAPHPAARTVPQGVSR